ncbi:MAG: hypothetical protein ABS20_01380 [SAR86 cluster bacterium BACL1 MAG-121022-bin58]|nr:MAG: hypothetical protein ABS09_04795 [SAR86 cluster bacterium BACL1 MAG-120619-bin26]KRP20445.1 MAG: hypothetical protein ABS20_01380 [SAR86 cluster bacterium BACL1 MAG-121022-bin58]KRP22895.1 MAG: hypothetical protein ABS19_01380 [SAR86 cluster bacterium BACL1 MAG-121015-bin70]
MENEVWALWSSMRTGIEISSIFIIVAIWVGARFTSVMVDKNVSMLPRIIQTVFGLTLMAWVTNIVVVNRAVVIGAAKAMETAGESTALSEGAQNYVDTWANAEPGLMANPIGALFLLSALLIIILPLWVKAD